MNEDSTAAPSDAQAAVDAEIDKLGGHSAKTLHPINQGRAAMRRLFYSKSPRKHTTRSAFHHPHGWRKYRHAETGEIRWLPLYLQHPPYAVGASTNNTNKERHNRYAMLIERRRLEDSERRLQAVAA